MKLKVRSSPANRPYPRSPSSWLTNITIWVAQDLIKKTMLSDIEQKMREVANDHHCQGPVKPMMIVSKAGYPCELEVGC